MIGRRLPLVLLLAALLAGCGDDGTGTHAYDDAELAFFGEIAFGFENGSPGDTLTLRKWSGDLRLRIAGFPSQRQIATVQDVADEIVALTDGIDIDVQAVGSTGPFDAEILFVSHDSMVALLGPIALENYGMFHVWWNADDEIDRGRVVIAYDRGTEVWLDHLIREELTQMLGLGRDSWTYEESIFYQGYSEVTEYLPIDRSVIRMLYDTRLAPGASRAEAFRILSGR